MKKERQDFFGKFQKDKVKTLAGIKGGTSSQDTKTTLCETMEGTFDTDPNSAAEEENGGRGCP